MARRISILAQMLDVIETASDEVAKQAIDVLVAKYKQRSNGAQAQPAQPKKRRKRQPRNKPATGETPVETQADHTIADP